MNIDQLKLELDKVDHIKSLRDGNDLIVSFRNLHVTKNFGCSNECFVVVSFDTPSPEVTTFPLDRSCALWMAVDIEINQMIQGLV